MLFNTISKYNLGFDIDYKDIKLSLYFLLEQLLKTKRYYLNNWKFYYFKKTKHSQNCLEPENENFYEYYNKIKSNINEDFSLFRRGHFSLFGLEFLENIIMKKDFIPLVYNKFDYENYEEFKYLQLKNIKNNIDYDIYSLLPFLHLYLFFSNVLTNYSYINYNGFVKCDDGNYYNMNFEKYDPLNFKHTFAIFIDSYYTLSTTFDKSNNILKTGFDLSFDISANTYFYKYYSNISSFRLINSDNKNGIEKMINGKYVWDIFPNPFFIDLIDPDIRKDSSYAISKNTNNDLNFLEKQDFEVSFVNSSKFVKENYEFVYSLGNRDLALKLAYENFVSYNNDIIIRKPHFYEIIPTSYVDENVDNKIIKTFNLIIYRFRNYDYSDDFDNSYTIKGDLSSDIEEPEKNTCCLNDCLNKNK